MPGENQIPKSKNPLPVTVVTGYLGSGKTTLINQLLSGAGERRTTVLVNDFGDIALDELLIENNNGDVISLANGCMCCQIGGDLYRAIDKILGMKDVIDHLVIETSGVADPSKISMIAVAEPELSLHGTLVLVDGLNFSDLLADQQLRDTIERQLSCADAALLSKTDLIEEKDVLDVLMQLREIALDLPITSSKREAIGLIERNSAFIKNDSMLVNLQNLGGHSLPFQSWSWQGTGLVQGAKLIALIEREELGVQRFKGRVRLADGTHKFIHKAGKQIEISACEYEFETSKITAIGKTSEFMPEDFSLEWQKIILN